MSRRSLSDAAAERYWPGQDPIGKRLRIDSSGNPAIEVVGIARPAKYILPAEKPRPMLFLPFAQNYVADQVLQLHTQGDPLALVPVIRAQVAALDPEMPIFDVRTMETHIREGKATVLFTLGSSLVGSFGLIGIVLAAVGLSGVIAYSVSRRTHEIGVRMALGASRAQVLGMVMRQGVVLTGIGLIVGGVVALVFTRSFANLLAGVSPTDGLTYAGVSILLTVVAMLATYIPARRATKVDPMEALRYE